jgi:hypothetical protein
VSFFFYSLPWIARHPRIFLRCDFGCGLFEGKTTMWEGVPEWAAVIVFFILMSVVGLEGMQIAFFAVAKIPASERDSVFAKKTCELLFKGGRNLLAS